MQNSPTVDTEVFSYTNSKRDNSLVRTTIELTKKCSWKDCGQPACKKLWHKPCSFAKLGLVRQLYPIVVLIGILEIIIGCILTTSVVAFAGEYDALYGTEESKLISISSFGGLLIMSVSGMALLIAVKLNKRRIMWVHILTATLLCISIFVESIMQIHYATFVLKGTMSSSDINPSNPTLFNTPILIGIITLLGSVVHFVGTIAVFTYYNLKYIHPEMFGYQTC